MLDEVVGTARRMHKAGSELREYKVLLMRSTTNCGTLVLKFNSGIGGMLALLLRCGMVSAGFFLFGRLLGCSVEGWN